LRLDPLIPAHEQNTQNSHGRRFPAIIGPEAAPMLDPANFARVAKAYTAHRRPAEDTDSSLWIRVDTALFASQASRQKALFLDRLKILVGGLFLASAHLFATKLGRAQLIKFFSLRLWRNRGCRCDRSLRFGGKRAA
jgi:hypothetical protein